MATVKYDSYIKFYINNIIDKAIEDAREKYALRSLAKSSFRQMIKAKRHYLMYDSDFMTRKTYEFVYPCYFQHG